MKANELRKLIEAWKEFDKMGTLFYRKKGCKAWVQYAKRQTNRIILWKIPCSKNPKKYYTIKQEVNYAERKNLLQFINLMELTLIKTHIAIRNAQEQKWIEILSDEYINEWEFKNKL